MASVAEQMVTLLASVEHIPGAQTALLAAARREARGIRRGRAYYRELHWGEAGGQGVQQQRVADPSEGPPVLMGVLSSVSYLSDKRGDGPSVYTHDFSRPLPGLAVSPRSGLLLVTGGGYTVEERGIVG